jgi:UDP-N-acetylmuramate--alanine ligase
MNKIHFVGIGGIGMSGIAEVLHNMNFIVSGSDISDNSNVKRLRSLGIKVFIGHSEDNVKGADVVVYTSAVSNDNPELVFARDNYIPIIMRGEMLAELMRMKKSIAIAGSHGKTSTTSMLAEIFHHAGMDPTVVIGGRLNSSNQNATLGKSEILIAEADESDRSFLILLPTVAVITNIDLEHLDTYKDVDDIKNAFVQFANKVPFYGLNVICLDDSNVMDIIPYIEKKFITYGIRAKADIKASNIKKEGFGISFDVYIFEEYMGRIKLGLPGEHNVLNALATIGVSYEFQIDFQHIKEALESYKGVQRRLTVKFDKNEITLIDDYGHHPTEIQTTLKAVRDAFEDREIIVVFQPHRYTRTQALMHEFSKCFFDADKLFITDIYAASEMPIEGINSEVLTEEIKKHGFKDVYYTQSMESILSYLDDVKEKTVIITLGAGNITTFSDIISKFLEEKYEE